MSDSNFLVTWGVFRALESACEGDGLPDSTVDALDRAAEDEIGVEGLIAGWSLVATKLRRALLEHAAKVGCSCGSLEWLEAEQLRHAALDDPEDREE
jgi:hypothetical protein